MSFIKKNFEEIHALLSSNKDKVIEDIMPQLLALMVSKQRDKNHHETDDGLEIFCYYHKEWELVSQVEFGSKASSATGYNSMCKVGVNAWTKQQRDFKSSKANLLEEMIAGDLEASDLSERIEEREIIKDSILPLIEYHEVIATIENDELLAAQAIVDALVESEKAKEDNE